MNEIGGYFELELSKGSYNYHDTLYAFKSGRSALHYILSVVKPSLVYIPYYTCNALLEPFAVYGTPYSFYEIDQSFEPKFLPELKAGEYFLYINYFDIKREYVNYLSGKYADKLIVDCTQAFFMKGTGVSWYFNSCRKYFGVPDGSYLYVPDNINPGNNSTRNEEYIVDHLIKRLNGHTREGYEFFSRNEVLCGSDIRGMSILSEQLLSHVNYLKAAAARRANYDFLNSRLKNMNLLELKSSADNVPMFYPLLLAKEINRELLYAENIFVPTLWKDTLVRSQSGYPVEKLITKNLYPLPVDHRYDSGDMTRMINVLMNIQ